jgi:hypothetical protein
MWLRGLLIHKRHTSAVNMAMAVNLGVTAVILGIGLWAYLPGLPTAAVALNTAVAAEVIYLAWRTQRLIPIGWPTWKQTRTHPLG